jgi:hypothetical protein
LEGCSEFGNFVITHIDVNSNSTGLSNMVTLSSFKSKTVLAFFY